MGKSEVFSNFAVEHRGGDECLVNCFFQIVPRALFDIIAVGNFLFLFFEMGYHHFALFWISLVSTTM